MSDTRDMPDQTATGDPRGQIALPRPGIALPRDALPVPLLLGLAGLLALALFLFLNAHRLAGQNGKATQAARLPDPPPALVIPSALPPPPPVLTTPPLNPLPASSPKSAVPVVRTIIKQAQPPVILPNPLPSPAPPPSNPLALVVDNTSSAVAANGPNGAAAGAGDDTARASMIHNRASVIPQGAIIAAVLETPLNSDHPGLARALVSKDARGFDGSRVLIPRGSRLIGEFRADSAPGLRRVLVNWTRLIRPDGVAIRINSPAADSLGGAGIPGSVNTHFFERFASAVLQSALAVGVNVASQQIPANGANAVFVGLPSQASQLGQQLVPNVNRAATVKVREGAQIAVLVAHDLDFGGTPAIR